ncbi:MAG: S8 family serine peptidase [Clostridia bacterium]|nr:S8 family serine peptidase [Clostridia bacterium]
MKAETSSKLKTFLKSAMWIAISLVIILVLYVAIRVIFFSGTVIGKDETPPLTEYYKSLASENKSISYDEESNTLFMNQEAIVVMKVGTTLEEAEAVAERHGARAEGLMENIGFFRFSFTDPMSLGKLKKAINEINDEELVDNAYVNEVFMNDEDEEGSSGITVLDPVYPNDPWNKASWSVKVPRGENWGMEAINAPGAWAYTDRLTSINIGLIDMIPKFDHEDLTFTGYQAVFRDGDSGDESINAYKLNEGAHYHGTHVAGTMAADPNDKGVTGVMNGKGNLYYAQTFVKNSGGYYTQWNTITGWLYCLEYLLNNDVRVINISMGYADTEMIYAASHGNSKAISDIERNAKPFEDYLVRKINERTSEGRPDFVICIAAGNANNDVFYVDSTATYGVRSKANVSDALKGSFTSKDRVSGGVDAKYANPISFIENEVVKSRVIVVGSVGINDLKSTALSTVLRYSDFSNGGDRVDIVAPGEDIYSTYSLYIDMETGKMYDYDYYELNGTSMASPHVSGVAGLCFAANPDLTGPEVKNILLNTAKGRYYYNDGYSGLVQAQNAVIVALGARDDKRIPELRRTTGGDGIDLCFVVDTTGSMGDDIANVRDNMKDILASLSEKTDNYRVAIIDYRDFASRTNDSRDYPSKVQLNFTNSKESITEGINNLVLGNGGDTPETVYSGIIEAVGLDWRAGAKKVIIILGDAGPLDPEPITGYTFDDVLVALKTKNIGIDYSESDKRAIVEMDGSEISVFSIGTKADTSAKEFFESISSLTEGEYSDVAGASEVSDAIISSIESIEIKTGNIKVELGSELAGKTVSVYDKKGLLLEKTVGPDGVLTLEAFEEGVYTWSSNDSHTGGEFKVKPSVTRAAIREEYKLGYAGLASAVKDNKVATVAILAGVIGLSVAAPYVTSGIAGLKAKGTARKAAKASSSENFKSDEGSGSPSEQSDSSENGKTE